jgi:hypothetical protein
VANAHETYLARAIGVKVFTVQFSKNNDTLESNKYTYMCVLGPDLSITPAR